jgi:DNA segregation ATPase FtsK/SpoIIIE, S-DNA-T family
MAIHDTFDTDESTIPAALRRFLKRRLYELIALLLTGTIIVLAVSLASWTPSDPSFNHATGAKPENWLGSFGAIVSDQLIQFMGLGVLSFLFIPLAWASSLFQHERVEELRRALVFWLGGTLAFTCLVATLPVPSSWPLTAGLGGNIGEIITGALLSLLSIGIKGVVADAIAFTMALAACWWTIPRALNVDLNLLFSIFARMNASFTAEVEPRARSKAKPKRASLLERLKALLHAQSGKPATAKRKTSRLNEEGGDVLGRFTPLSLKRPQTTAEIEDEDFEGEEGDAFASGTFDDSLPFEAEDGDDAEPVRKSAAKALTKPKLRPRHKFELPSLDLLAEPKKVGKLPELSKDFLEENARRLESVLEDFGVRGQIINVRPGPVVTLYELEPAPGIKSSRVISLADDIARSMSAVSARVAVVSGRNAIGIELPNSKRETVYLRELLQSENFTKSNSDLTLALGKNIGGEPIFANLARMPHLLIAGTTGSGKSVGINTMILSLLYRLPPEKCKLIMIDPKMLELSVYEGIPHLLAPVVTDPRKAVVALKWAVREMEDRYKKMSKTGVRNVDGYNAKIAQMLEKGQKLSRTVQTGFDAETGQPVFEQEEMDLAPMPYIVVIIDEMADLMMVAGKDIEGAVQRLAQMARAAGIHVVMATQRPSVDVITGTIKANFPTRISFQVTSKIDSRTILGEQGAEQLLGQGDMLYMAGGGRISRLHAPFVSDGEVEDIVNHLKAQGAPEYVEAVTEEDEDGMAGEGGMLPGGEGGSGDELYDQAVQVVLRDKKVSTSYVQRRLGVGYNKAATLIERMENEGLISSPNGQGKREILVPGDSARP